MHADAAQPDTRTRIVEAARELFWRQGYHATGVKQILETAGANAGSLYFFFKTKEDLLVAVLERYLEMMVPFVFDPAFQQTGDPVERIFAVLDGYRALLVSMQFRIGCPIGNLALELQDASERVRALINQNFANWCAQIEQCLAAAIQQGRLAPDLDRTGTAQFVLTVMEGGMMQARALQNVAPFDRCVAQLRGHFSVLETAAAGAAPRPARKPAAKPAAARKAAKPGRKPS